jgi:hypothetical protein
MSVLASGAGKHERKAVGYVDDNPDSALPGYLRGCDLKEDSMQRSFQMILMQILGCGLTLMPLRAADPITGTWKLDVRKSKFVERPPKEETETYRELVSGDIEMVLTRTQQDGASTIVTLTWPALGGAVHDPAGTLPKGEAIIETLLGPGDWIAIFLTDGKQQSTMHKVISSDGKTMVQTFKTVDPQGRPGEQVQVLRRQDTRSLRR